MTDRLQLNKKVFSVGREEDCISDSKVVKCGVIWCDVIAAC